MHRPSAPAARRPAGPARRNSGGLVGTRCRKSRTRGGVRCSSHPVVILLVPADSRLCHRAASRAGTLRCRNGDGLDCAVSVSANTVDNAPAPPPSTATRMRRPRVGWPAQRHAITRRVDCGPVCSRRNADDLGYRAALSSAHDARDDAETGPDAEMSRARLVTSRSDRAMCARRSAADCALSSDSPTSTPGRVRRASRN